MQLGLDIWKTLLFTGIQKSQNSLVILFRISMWRNTSGFLVNKITPPEELGHRSQGYSLQCLSHWHKLDTLKLGPRQKAKIINGTKVLHFSYKCFLMLSQILTSQIWNCLKLHNFASIIIDKDNQDINISAMKINQLTIHPPNHHPCITRKANIPLLELSLQGNRDPTKCQVMTNVKELNFFFLVVLRLSS